MNDLLVKLKIILFGDGKLRQALDKATKGLKDVEDSGEKAGKSVDELGKKSVRTGNRLGEAAKKASDLVTAVKGFIAVRIVGFVRDSVVGFDRINRSLEQVTGSTEAAAEEFEYIRGVASRLGLDLGSTAEQWTLFAASVQGTALEGEESRRIFEAFAGSMSKLGQSSADTEGVLKALRDMIGKNTVQAEELKGQLGDRLPGAMKLAADAMEINTDQLGAMLANGEILASDLLPRMATELERLYDTGSAVDSITASWNRFVSIISDAANTITTASGATDLFSGALELLGNTISFVTVGFVSLREAIVATGTAYAELWEFLTTDQSWEQTIQNINDAWDEARLTIEKTADETFSLNENLRVTGEQGAKAGKALGDGMKEGAGGTLQAKIAMDKLSERTKLLNKELKATGITLGEIASGISGSTSRSLAAFNRLLVQTGVSSQQLVRGLQEAAKGVESLDVLRVMILQVKDAVDQGRLSDTEATAAKQALANAAQSIVEGMQKSGVSAEEAATKVKQLTNEINGIPSSKTVNIQVNTNKSEVETTTKAVKDLGTETGKTDSVQQQFEQHLADTGDTMEGWGAGLAFLKYMQGWVSDAAKEMAGLSQKSAEFFNQWIESGGANGLINTMRNTTSETTRSGQAIKELGHRIRDISTEMQFANGALSKWFKNIGRQTAIIKKAFLEEQQAVQAITNTLNSAGTATEAVIGLAEQAIDGFQYLDDQQLSGVRSQVASLKAETQSLRDEINSTVQDLQDEQDRLLGNEQDIQDREYERRKQKLEEALEEARKKGLIQEQLDAQKALELLRENHAIRINNLEAEREGVAAINEERQKENELIAAGNKTLPGSPVSGTGVTAPNGNTTGPATATDPSALAELPSRIAEALKDVLPGNQVSGSNVYQLKTPAGSATISGDGSDELLKALDQAKMVSL